MIKFPTYYSQMTLLGGEPDINRRSIYRTDHSLVATFNYEMATWSLEKAEEFRVCLKALRDLAASNSGATKPMCVFDTEQDPEIALAREIKSELGVDIDPKALRMFIRYRWELIAPLTHAIHGTIVD